MITRLQIESFKSWRDTGALRFAPLTPVRQPFKRRRRMVNGAATERRGGCSSGSTSTTTSAW
jgi:hypothetical protein